jgi:hypothetical protein
MNRRFSSLRLCFPALFLVSLGLGALLFFLSRQALPQEGEAGDFFEGYAALSLGESIPDRETALALEAALGRPLISASSQWVYVDSFGSLEQVPLEAYDARLEPFDPRRDGYADRLHAFFVRDGRRWFFIPLDGDLKALLGSDLRRGLEQRIAEVTGDDFSLELKLRQTTTPARPLRLYLALFVPAWGVALFLGRRRGNRSASLLLLGPLLAPLSLWGPPGFALMALCCFLGALIKEPLREFTLGRRKGPFLAPYRSRLVFIIPLALVLAAVLWFGGFSLPAALLNLLCLGGGFFCATVLETGRRRSGRRFIPVPILPPRRLSRSQGFTPQMLPFLLASLLAIPAGFFAGGLGAVQPTGSPLQGKEWPLVVLEEDYQAHLNYQMNFSRRPLGLALQEPGYFRYTLGEDGLVAGQFPAATDAAGELPPFPLADLSAFLSGWGLVELELAAPWAGRDLIPPLLVLLITVPALIIRGGKQAGWKKRSSAYYDKRIAA